MPRRPATRSRKTNPVHSNRILKRTHNHIRAPTPRAKSGNMQKPHTDALVRRMVRISTWTGGRPQRDGTQRLPLRPHRSSPRISRLGERRLTDPRRTAPTLPLRPKKTTQNLVFTRQFQFRGAFAVLSTSPRSPVLYQLLRMFLIGFAFPEVSVIAVRRDTAEASSMTDLSRT